MSAPRVVIADDSAFMRRLISDALTRDGMEVVATAANGRDAIEACRQHSPDVLSLDLAMPEVDGIGVLRALRDIESLRIVVVSSFSESEGIRAVDALAEGAFELVPKQSSSGKLQDFLDDLLAKIQAASFEHDRSSRERPKAPHRPERSTRAAETGARGPADGGGAKRKLARAATTNGRRLVVIAASTGGPRALTTLMTDLPAGLGQGGLIIQHMPTGFTKSLAARLDTYSGMTVSEASAGDKIVRGHAFVAPGGRHMRVRGHKIRLSDDPAVTGLRPCADITIADAVGEYGENIVLAVLTGMGRDACAGARQVREAGGIVIVEHGATTTVNGMPKAVSDAGLADAILPIYEIGAAVREAAGG
ncbi:MAG: chemotaxis-specific protein-glutamate methyltransferase CheB [Solirubrobacterales bacterium]